MILDNDIDEFVDEIETILHLLKIFFGKIGIFNSTSRYARKTTQKTIEAIFIWHFETKIDDAFGDRNLVCSCEPIENYK